MYHYNTEMLKFCLRFSFFEGLGVFFVIFDIKRDESLTKSLLKKSEGESNAKNAFDSPSLQL